MTIKETKILRNMFIIGGTMTTGSFFFGMAKFSKSYTPNYTPKKFTGPIKTISDIEDFERTNSCNFLFHDTGGTAKNARDYSGSDTSKQTKVASAAESQRANCTQNRFVYIKL